MLTQLLIRMFVRGAERPEEPTVRLGYGILAGGCGLVVNLLLFAVKLTVGILSGSVAVMADAVNNLSDSGSAAVTIFGFRLSARPPDNEHPFGHGRLEYIAGLIVAVFIIAVGMNFFKESVGRIFHPSPITADNLMLIILGSTLLVKLWLFFFYRTIGRKIHSEVIIASAFDSLSDILGTAVVIGAVFAVRFTAFPIDGCAGAVVAGVVLFGGIKILKNTVNPLLGECPDPTLVRKLEQKLIACPGINGVHDMILHNYGPNRYFATAHAEVDRGGDLMSMHDTLEAAEVAVAQELPIRLVLHCDPYDTVDPTVKMWRARLEDTVGAFDDRLKVYDFRLLATEQGAQLAFHLLVPRNYAVRGDAIAEHLETAMRQYDPGVTVKITFVNAFV